MALQSPSLSVVTKVEDLINFADTSSTSIAAHVGQFQKGPANIPTFITTKNDLLEVFGEPSDENYEDWYSAANFLTYSSGMWIVRVVDITSALNGVARGAASLVQNSDEFDAVKTSVGVIANEVIAAYPGTSLNGVSVDFADNATFENWQYKNQFADTPSTSPWAESLNAVNDELHAVIVDVDGNFTGRPGTILQTFSFLSKASDSKNLDSSANYYIDVINSSQNFVFLSAIPQLVADYAVGGSLVLGTITAGATYSPSATVAITDSTGPGISATATVTIGNFGGIDALSVDTPGTDYIVGEAIVITSTSGTGFTGEVATIGGSGEILTVTILTPGTGYDDVLSVSITTAIGTAGVISATIVGGEVISATLTNVGENYETPVFTITDSTGVGASVVITALPDYDDAWGTATLNKSFQNLSQVLSLKLAGGLNSAIASIGATELNEGWELLNDPDKINAFYFIAGSAGGDTDSIAVIKKMISIAEARKDVIVFYSPRKSDLIGKVNAAAVADSMIEYKTVTLATVSDTAFMDSGWGNYFDRFSGKNRLIPLNGATAGIAARVDAEKSQFESLASGLEGRYLDLISLPFSPNKTLRDKLYPKSINPVSTITGFGTVIAGDRTNQIRGGSFRAYNVKKTIIFMIKVLSRLLQSHLARPNDQFERTLAKSEIEPILRTLEGLRAIKSNWEVISDTTNNTPSDEVEGILNIAVFITPIFSIQTINLNIISRNNELTFTATEV